MHKDKNKTLILQEDYSLLSRYINSLSRLKRIGKKDISRLWAHLRNAVIVEKEGFPGHIARLNSTVIIKNLHNNLTKAYTIVLPENADKRKGMVSVLSPAGMALLGLKKGLQFSWDLWARGKGFSVLEVYNSPSLESSMNKQIKLISS